MPLAVNRPGFNRDAVSTCYAPFTSIPLSDPSLAANTSLAPLYYVETGAAVIDAAYAAAARSSLNLVLVSLGPIPAPPLIFILKQVTLPTSADGQVRAGSVPLGTDCSSFALKLT
jgi:hypothetical protein